MYSRIIFITLFMVVSYSVFSQQANFQGKVYSNGVPVIGAHQVQFFIGPSLNWSSVPVNVTVVNGLYSTPISFPSNLFDDQNAYRQMVVYMDGNVIDTVMIFAPIERDSIARSYIRDSIKWANIHEKPTVDTSLTNEYQFLTLNGDTLQISNGNAVKLPGISTVVGNFKVLDTTKQNMINVGVTGATVCNGITNTSAWQSFYTTSTGKLRELILPVGISHSCNNIVVHFYEGTGTSGQSLGHKSFTITNSLVSQTLDLSNGINSSSTGSLHFTVGKVYTFSITPQTGCSISVNCNNANPYTNGISSFGSNTDIAFSLNIDHSSPSIFSVNKIGNVGLGIDSATAKFEVKGRIKDQSGFLVPVGTVFAYSGRKIPDGWLLCDGRVVSRTDYPDLYNEIDTSWGTGSGVGTFNLPDFRGLFLRGVDDSPTEGTTNNDQDKNSRYALKPGGNTGNNVGSAQTDTIKAHNHNSITDPLSGKTLYGAFTTIAPVNTSYGNANLQPFNGGGSAFYLHTLTNSALANQGGNETRPKNAAVYFIVKY